MNDSLAVAKVLVVDDHKTMQKKLSMAIRALGYQSVIAGSGMEALECLSAERFDLVLLDIVMPEMDGFEVLQAIKSNVELRNIPVVVISALDSEMDSVVKAIDLGAEDFLPKNFDKVLFKARINSSLEKKRHRDQEVEYIRQVERLTKAASALENSHFNPDKLGINDIAERADSLGKLGSVFLNMAQKVYERERRLRRQIDLLKGGMLLLLLGAVWGLIPPLSRLVMLDEVHALKVAPWTLGIGALVMIVVSIVKRRRPKFDVKTLRYYLLWGIFGGVLPNLFILWTAEHIQASLIAIIMASEAFMVFMVATLLRLEKSSFKRFLGLGLGLCAVVIIIAPGYGIVANQDWVWVLFCLAIPACYTAEDLLIAVSDPGKSDPVVAIASMLSLATLMIIPFSAATGNLTALNYPFGNIEWAIVLLGLLIAAGNLVLIYLIRTTGVVFASQSAYVITAVALLWSLFLLDERLPVAVWIALAIMVAGLVLVMPKEDGEDPSLSDLVRTGHG
jgi:DNA-binding response OmpR family regulator/drug/metabolite transporter (DMT)-like permease